MDAEKIASGNMQITIATIQIDLLKITIVTVQIEITIKRVAGSRYEHMDRPVILI